MCSLIRFAFPWLLEKFVSPQALLKPPEFVCACVCAFDPDGVCMLDPDGILRDE